GFDELKLHELIDKGSLDFEGWTSLISRVERTYPDNIEKICLAYDSFLSEFPLCHGYWRRFADHKARLCALDKVVEVFERAVQSATYSVGVWVDYCNFSMSAFEDPSDIRRLFRRGISYVGKDYLCHALWDKYIEFELSQQQWSFLAHIYIEALRFPTKKLHHYHDSFKKLAALCNKELGCASNCAADLQSGSFLDDEVPKRYRMDEISCVIKDLLEPSISLGRSKALLQKYLYIGEQLYQESCRLDEKISTFENNIRRSYFHVKSVDVDQLENWHHYLDFIEMQGDFDWVVKLYERCLIPCANYPEFWMRYAEFMETKGGREIANYALNRATQIFLKRVPVMHLFNARFKEHLGDIIGARAARLHCDGESDSNFVENVVMKANMEKRLGNFVAACNIFAEALAMAVLKKKSHTLPILYVHFSRLKYMITDSADAARDVLIDGIKRLPSCKLLLEELINFAILHGGQQHILVVDSVIANAISPGPDPDISQVLNVKDAEDISSLYLKFVDLCGTIDQVRKAWNRHVRLFPYSVRSAIYEQLTADVKSLQLTKEGREDTVVTKHQQPSGDLNLNSLVQMPLQDRNMSLLENCDTRTSVQDSTNLDISEKKVPTQEIHDTQFEQAPSNQFPSGEADRGEGQRVMLPTSEVSEQSRKDMPEINVQSLDLVSSPKQRTEDATALNVPSSNLICEVAEGTESVPTLKEHSNGDDLKQDSDHEPQQDMKPLSLESLSLHSQDKPSPDSNPFVPFASEAPQEICIANESMRESNQRNNDDSLTHSQRTTKAFDSPQIEIEGVMPSSSTRHQNPISTEPQFRQHMPVNSGGNSHRMSNSSKFRRESKFGFRGHSQRRSHRQQQISSLQHPQAELGGPMPMGQGYPSHIVSPQNLQTQQGSQAQNQYQTTPANITPPPHVTCTVQNMQQPNSASSSQPVQGSGEHGMQNSQTYDQMWQYYYYQQQNFLQQQQQQQPMSQQYQQQQLQLQQQYLQWQQQQYLYYQQLHQHPQQQQQQLQRQSHQVYLHQVPQQPQQEQIDQNQHQQQNPESQIQEWNHSNYQQGAPSELDGSNQSGVELAPHNITSRDQAIPPSHTSGAGEAGETVTSPSSQEQSPAKQ
ncbi:HAT (Half-A-TPR) repeat, partial [Parasponia andersonii]